MNVADLFQLQGAFQGRWKIVMATEVQEITRNLAYFVAISVTASFDVQGQFEFCRVVDLI